MERVHPKWSEPRKLDKKLSGFIMQKRKKHGYAECLNYMQMIEAGISIHAIHMKYGINEDRLHVLWNRYQSDGRSGLF